MQQLEKLFSHPKSRKVGIILALLSTIVPWPIAGVHKFYLGQPVWGVIYLQGRGGCRVVHVHFGA